MMMKWKKYSLLAVLVLATTTNIMASGKQDYEKVKEATYTVKPGVKLYVGNTYGDVDIEPWDKNEVYIKAVIEVKTSSESKANEIFDQIGIEITGDEREVYATTTIESSEGGSWWNWSSWTSSKADYKINYTVRVPRETKLFIENGYGNITNSGTTTGNAKLTNKYGHIYSGDINGDLTIELKYGDAKIGTVHDANIIVKYGKVTMENMRDGTIESKYSKVRLGVAEDLIINSKYDGYEIVEASTITNTGGYDDYKVGSAGSITLDTKYSNWTVEKLSTSLRLDAKYTGVTIRHTLPTLEEVKIDSKYTNVSLYKVSDFSLVFEGDRTSLQLPDGFDKKLYEEDDGDLNVKGHYRSAVGAKIDVEMRYGSFKAKE